MEHVWFTTVPDLLVFYSVLFYEHIIDTNKAFIRNPALRTVRKHRQKFQLNCDLSHISHTKRSYFEVTHNSIKSYTSSVSLEQSITGPHSEPKKCSPHIPKLFHKKIFHYYYLHTNSLTLRSRVLLQKLTGFQPVNKFPTFYGAQRFINIVTSARHLVLS
jgi:hypothetical protein